MTVRVSFTKTGAWATLKYIHQDVIVSGVVV